MGRRPLKTVPAGQPPPIFSTTRCNPNGVPFEPSVCPMPKREVEQRVLPPGCQVAESFSKSETVWSATFTSKARRVGGTPSCRHLRRPSANKPEEVPGIVDYFNFFTSIFEFRPLCSYFSRRADGKSSGVPSAKPPLD